MIPQAEFKDSEFLSAHDKKRILVAWERFFRLGLEWNNFSKAIYEHLHLHCSFIAHFDRAGFYSTYFENPESTIHFLHQFDSDFGRGSIEYGGASWWLQGEYADINSAMCQVVDQFKAGLYESLGKAARSKDVGLAKALLAKHGIAFGGESQ
mgnify:FL=1